MKRQPGIPKGKPEESGPPFVEDNFIVVDFGPSLTPEQKKWPVVRLRGMDPPPPESGIEPRATKPAPADQPPSAN